MANRFQILETLINSTKQVFNLQILRLDELYTKDYPYNSSKDHIKLLHVIYVEGLNIIKKIEDDFKTAKDDADYIEIETELKEVSHAFTYLGGIATKIISSSTREFVSQNTVSLIKYLTGPFKNDSRFILIPTDDHNYEITRWGYLLQLIINDFNIVINPAQFYPPTVFSILSFPAIYKDNLIAHSLLGHEIGHFIIWKKSLGKEFSQLIKFDQNQMQSVIDHEISSKTKEQNKIFSKNEKEKLENTIHQEIRSNVEDGTEELLCDLIGFRIMGPVLLFASAEFFLSDTHAYQPFAKYPPPALRLQSLIDEIKHGNYIQKINDVEIEKYVQELVDENQNYITPENTYTYTLRERLQYETWKKIIPELKKIADKVIDELKDFRYSPDTFGNDMLPLIKKLKRLIPPCEIEEGKPAHVISILNAGMIFRLKWKSILPKLSIHIQSKIESKLDLLVIRSVQQSEIEQELQNAEKESRK